MIDSVSNIIFPPRVHFVLNANSFQVMILLVIFLCQINWYHLIHFTFFLMKWFNKIGFWLHSMYLVFFSLDEIVLVKIGTLVL